MDFHFLVCWPPGLLLAQMLAQIASLYIWEFRPVRMRMMTSIVTENSIQARRRAFLKTKWHPCFGNLSGPIPIMHTGLNV